MIWAGEVGAYVGLQQHKPASLHKLASLHSCLDLSHLFVVSCACAKPYMYPGVVRRRFESRWINVQIADDSPSLWLAGMGGSTIGVWAAHGEGQVLFPEPAVQAAVLDKKLAPIR